VHQLGTDVQRLLNQLLENAEEMPYSFHLEETEITSNLAASFGKLASQSTEPWMPKRRSLLQIRYES
jgi:hypothetical protein